MVRFELHLRAKSATTYVFWVVLLLLAFWAMVRDSFIINARVSAGGPWGVHRDAESFLAMIAVLLLAVTATVVSSVSGIGIYRDFEANSHTLFFTTRLTKAGYWYGRFVGSFLVVLGIFSAVPLGFLLGNLLPGETQAHMGPFHAETYTALCLHYLIPDLFFLSVLFFVGGALTRSLLAIYTQGIVLLVLVLGTITLGNALGDDELTSLFDPFGFASIAYATRYWTIYELNRYAVPFTGALVQNRLLWSGLGIVLLIGGYFVFDFSHAPRAARRRIPAAEPVPIRDYKEPEVATSPAGWRYHLASYGQLLRLYSREILTGVPFIAITLCGIVFAIFSASQEDKVYGTAVYPVTRIVLQSITGIFPYFFYALISFYTGELLWRERVLRSDQVSDSLPVSSAITLATKISAILVMIGALCLALIAAGITGQLMQGFTHIDLPLYFRWLYGITFIDYALIVALVFLLQTAINNKFLGHLALAVLIVAKITALKYLSERNLFYYGAHPDFVYSDMNGFGPFLPAVRWHQFYWFACGILLVILTLKLMIRGTDYRWKVRWHGSPLSKTSKTVAALFGLAFVGAGAFIFYNTDVLNTFVDDPSAQTALYEKQYKKRYERMPQPRITRIKLDVSLHPESGQYTLRGVYTLRNKTTTPIREIVLDYNQELTIKRLVWSIPTRPGVTDLDQGFRTFLLDTPLAPGAEMTLDFEMAQEHVGFRNAGARTRVVANGTFLRLPAPRIGYQPYEELSDPQERRKYGLPERRIMPPVTDTVARGVTYLGNDADWIAFDAIVRTTPGQTALAPGYLVKQWDENGQHCFQYHMDTSIRDFYSIFSARYAAKKDTWTAKDGKKVALAVYYDAAHPYDIERMLNGVKGELSYCSDNFAPYQFRELRILEFPDYAKYAQSFPTTVPYSEGFGFIARVDDKNGDLDYPFYVSAHETAHQWWGHQVVGGNVEGSEMLSESLAEYSALMVVKKKYGMSYLRRFLRYDLDGYLIGRNRDTTGENPLVKAQHQQYIHYDKGSLVFCALAERFGEKRLNAILARFLRDKKFQEPPYTTAAELVSYLKQGATEDEKAYIRDLFEKITIYECQAERARRKRQPNGKWQMTLTYTVRKYYANAAGEQDPAPFNGEVLDVGVFDKSGAKYVTYSNALGAALKTEPVVLKNDAGAYWKGVTRRRVVFHDLPSVPYYAGIDPYNVMIDRTTNNNIVSIQDE